MIVVYGDGLIIVCIDGDGLIIYSWGVLIKNASSLKFIKFGFYTFLLFKDADLILYVYY